TALGTLPKDRTGAGAGVFKMSSSLGAALGIAISTSVFLALRDGTSINSDVALAGTVALGINVVFAVIATITAAVLIPKVAGKVSQTSIILPDPAIAVKI